MSIYTSFFADVKKIRPYFVLEIPKITIPTHEHLIFHKKGATLKEKKGSIDNFHDSLHSYDMSFVRTSQF